MTPEAKNKIEQGAGKYRSSIKDPLITRSFKDGAEFGYHLRDEEVSELKSQVERYKKMCGDMLARL